ncbi:MAG TPA: protein DpdE [Polyangiaceae bacterium]|nr:protein DpdE [Polyangiaceae bacterium]
MTEELFRQDAAAADSLPKGPCPGDSYIMPEALTASLREGVTLRTLPTGVFVQVDASADGLGKFAQTHGAEADIEYFVSPAGPRVHRVRVPLVSVRQVELSPQTRVFWFDLKELAWRAGRVDGGLVRAEALQSTEDHYHVRFPNGHDARVPVSQLYVRWGHPIEDPTDYLAHRITDTPFFFDGRSHIVRYLANQRAAFGGITALACSAIELLPHQVTTVRRVLADPVERYLLADEVGLGKTIEAGILIRQHVIDRPRDARVLVVVPKHLVQQWESELASKFCLPPPGPVAVISEDSLGETNAAATLTMLVVDEAHRSALRAFDPDPRERHLFQCLRTLAQAVPRVLLLSGTPVLHQEDGFLAMLHLLDPDGYRLEDRESFRRRVRDRQTIAETTADLDDDASSLFVEEAINRLGELFADDARLMELCGAVRSLLGSEVGGAERIKGLRALRTHVTETYRLHRRLLRTRREDPRVRDQLPRRMGATVVEHEDHAREESFDFLEAWRLAVAGRETGADVEQPKSWERLFGLWVEAALSHPRVLVRRIDARLALRSDRPMVLPVREHELLASGWAFDGEETLLRECRKLIAASLEPDVRALRLAEWLKANSVIAKVVVFVDDPQVADLVTSTLKGELGGDAVVRHELDGEGVRAFEEEKALRLLICDASAEEGLNFQRFGAAIVHYDLPLEPARVEQRIGRVDRIEARGRMRNVVLTSGGPYERAWLACLTDTVRVFDRSVAPLQYVLLEATATIRARLLSEGPAAIDAEAARMRDAKSGVDAELRRIRAQETLDSIEADPERDDEFFKRLTTADEAAEEDGEDAFDSWVVTRLQFVRRTEGQSIRYTHDPRRPTLVPLLETAARFASCVDRNPEARRSMTELPFQPFTFERAAAEKDGRIGLLRVGHAFVEAIEDLVRADDRGAAFAMWRHVPGAVASPQVFFRFDFVVAADIARAREMTEPHRGSAEALRRRADEVFPIEYRTVWLDSDLDAVQDAGLLAMLELPYSREQRRGGGNDTNLRVERWMKVDTLVPLGDWGGLCGRARDAAERLLRADDGFRGRCLRYERQLHERALAVDDALRSRIARLVGSAREAEACAAEFERQLAESLAIGVKSPSLRVDSAGAILLSGAAWVEE